MMNPLWSVSTRLNNTLTDLASIHTGAENHQEIGAPQTLSTASPGSSWPMRHFNQGQLSGLYTSSWTCQRSGDALCYQISSKTDPVQEFYLWELCGVNKHGRSDRFITSDCCVNLLIIGRPPKT